MSGSDSGAGDGYRFWWDGATIIALVPPGAGKPPVYWGDTPDSVPSVGAVELRPVPATGQAEDERTGSGPPEPISGKLASDLLRASPKYKDERDQDRAELAALLAAPPASSEPEPGGGDTEGNKRYEWHVSYVFRNSWRHSNFEDKASAYAWVELLRQGPNPVRQISMYRREVTKPWEPVRAPAVAAQPEPEDTRGDEGGDLPPGLCRCGHNAHDHVTVTYGCSACNCHGWQPVSGEPGRGRGAEDDRNGPLATEALILANADHPLHGALAVHLWRWFGKDHWPVGQALNAVDQVENALDKVSGCLAYRKDLVVNQPKSPPAAPEPAEPTDELVAEAARAACEAFYGGWVPAEEPSWADVARAVAQIVMKGTS